MRIFIYKVLYATGAGYSKEDCENICSSKDAAAYNFDTYVGECRCYSIEQKDAIGLNDEQNWLFCDCNKDWIFYL